MPTTVRSAQRDRRRAALVERGHDEGRGGDRGGREHDAVVEQRGEALAQAELEHPDHDAQARPQLLGQQRRLHVGRVVLVDQRERVGLVEPGRGERFPVQPGRDGDLDPARSRMRIPTGCRGCGRWRPPTRRTG
jgi:hypothetical protein